MFPLVPPFTVPAVVWKGVAIAIAAAAAAWWIYDAGQDSKQGEMDALQKSYDVAAAQSAARESERLRMWQQASIQAGRQYDERAKIADSSFDASLDRLRNAYQSSARLRPPASVAGSCDETGRATAAELLGMGETLARLVREADRDRAALVACVGAWPR